MFLIVSLFCNIFYNKKKVVVALITEFTYTLSGKIAGLSDLWGGATLALKKGIKRLTEFFKFVFPLAV